ncbi:hypothetical protein [Nocardioides sp. MH1]|uniref:hypothetical protein n=1 Tax=Nocardioides sp. MH1 TaxID=3242490 RepID=UPI00351FFDF2
MSFVLVLREVPRKGVRLSAGLAAAETTAALAIAHGAAGGELPSAAALGVIVATSYGAGLLVLRRHTPMRVALPALVGLQLVLHAWLVALSGGTGHVHDGGSEALLGLSWPMLAAHAAAGVAAALAWALRRRVVEVVLGWAGAVAPAVPLRARTTPSSVVRRPASRPATAHPTRGPPQGLGAAA